MDFHGLAFRTETRFRGASLAAALNAVNNPSLPVNPLHWDGALDVDSVNTWDPTSSISGRWARRAGRRRLPRPPAESR